MCNGYKATSESVAAEVVADAWQGRVLLLGEGGQIPSELSWHLNSAMIRHVQKLHNSIACCQSLRVNRQSCYFIYYANIHDSRDDNTHTLGTLTLQCTDINQFGTLQ